MPLILLPEDSKEYREKHFLGWAVPRKGIYVPTLFAFRDQQPLTLTIPCRVYGRRTKDGWEIDADRVKACYDYVWMYNPAGLAGTMPESYVELFRAQGLTVYQVR